MGLTAGYTEQWNIATDQLDAYGYMYSGEAEGPDVLMDYYCEKDLPYVKNDNHIAVPFNNADNFSVTGQGLSGGFRLHNKNAGHFRPNEKSSLMVIGQLGGEIAGGLNIDVGVNIGVGGHELSVKNWDGDLENYQFASHISNAYEEIDEPYFFSFNNDMGGNISFGNTELTKAKMTGSNTPGSKWFQPTIPSSVDPTINKGKSRSGRSSYIGYTLNHEFPDEGELKHKVHTRHNPITGIANIDRKALIGDGIGEFYIYNENGQNYTYGLPVYSRFEQNMSGMLETVKDNHFDNTGRFIHFDISALKTGYESNNTKTGQEIDQPYATTWLLTQINTPDYVDVRMDGPTPDDKGGYTKFNYSRTYGSDNKGNGSKTAHNNNWFKWRIPYTGLFYDRGELGDGKDDRGSYSSGEKEIYYLHSIETKTHIAKFHTSQRLDAIEALKESTASTTKWHDVTTSDLSGMNQLSKLDSITLHAKNADGQPGRTLKKIVFDYDYELMPGCPNSKSQNGSKLTLKRVWFEYNGTAPFEVSPYEFSYTYKQDYDDQISAVQNHATNHPF